MNVVNFVLFLLVCAPVADGVERKPKLNKLKTDLLTLLEVKEKPFVSRSRSEVPKYVIDLYKQQAHGNGFTKHLKAATGRTVRTFFRGE